MVTRQKRAAPLPVGANLVRVIVGGKDLLTISFMLNRRTIRAYGSALIELLTEPRRGGFFGFRQGS